jgi:hypothetical protein
MQSPAFVVATSGDNAIPFAGTTAPSGPFIAWAIVYGIGWWLLANRWFRRRDL